MPGASAARAQGPSDHDQPLRLDQPLHDRGRRNFGCSSTKPVHCTTSVTACTTGARRRYRATTSPDSASRYAVVLAPRWRERPPATGALIPNLSDSFGQGGSDVGPLDTPLASPPAVPYGAGPREGLTSERTSATQPRRAAVLRQHGLGRAHPVRRCPRCRRGTPRQPRGRIESPVASSRGAHSRPLGTSARRLPSAR